MNSAMFLRSTLLTVFATVLLAGCNATTGSVKAGGKTAATPVKPTPAKFEVEENVGFTITENVRVSGDVRFDYDEALRLLDSGQAEAGMQLLESIAERAPKLSAPFIDLGVAKHAAGDIEAAERYLAHALKLQPGQPVVHNELGIIYRKTGRFDEAKASYERALAIYPGYHYARRNLAVLCDLYLGDLDCALQNYEAYMQTVPGDEQANIWIADLKMRMGQ